MASPIRLLIFDDRVEISSPGGLPDGLTIEDIKFGMSVQRNKFIAKLCSQTMIYRGLGSGVRRIIKIYGDAEFVNTPKQFITILHRDTSLLEVDSKVDSKSLEKDKHLEILSLIKENPNITQIEMCKKLNLSRTSITNKIKRLQEQGILKREGSDKAGRWIVL